MYYQSAKFGDDMSSGFCVIVLTYTPHPYRAANRPNHTGYYVGVSNDDGEDDESLLGVCG